MFNALLIDYNGKIDEILFTKNKTHTRHYAIDAR